MLAESLKTIRLEIKKAAANAPLTKDVTLLAASKGQSKEHILEAIGLGVHVFGENRVQETQEKWPGIKKAHAGVSLHLIGPLQTNKVRQALSLFDVVQTLDRPKLALAIAGELKKSDHRFFIQVNTGDEPQKAGISLKEADDFIRYCKDGLKLPVTGLMCIPPADEDPAPHFALLAAMAKRHALSELSMGMRGDNVTAIKMGATCIRIGTALFGPR